MSSKPADGYSLQRRMIAVTTATLCGIALTAGVLTFTVSWQYLMRRVYTMVDRLVEDLQDEYHELGGLTTEFAQHMDIDAAEHDVNRTFIVLSTRNGRELRATSMPERLKARILRAVHQGRREHRFYTERASPSDRHVAVRLKTLELNDGNLITVARDVTDIERYLLFLALTQGIAVILGAFFTGLGVTLIVTRFVRRLKAVASTATAIEAGDWSRRVEEEKKESREVRALVRAFNGMCDKNEKTLNELRVLTDNIAHDLRTPLTRLDARRELLWVGDDIVAHVSSALPQVVDEEVFVACLHQAACHHGIGCLADKLLVDVAFEHVPGHPSHGWSGCQFAPRGRLGLRACRKHGHQAE